MKMLVRTKLNDFLVSKHFKVVVKIMVTCLNLEVNTSHGNMSDLSVFWPFLRTKQKKICRYLSLPQRAAYPPQVRLAKKSYHANKTNKVSIG